MADSGRDPTVLRVEVVWADPQRQLSRQLQLQPGATALDAVCASGLLAELGMQLEELAGIGLWGRHLDGKRRLRPEEYRVRDGDRIEMYRPLPVPPKEARRRRQAASEAVKKQD